MAKTATKKRARLAEDRPKEDRLDATPERIGRAMEAEQRLEKTPLTRLQDPFDLMRANRLSRPTTPGSTTSAG